ncbi:hypothetical protein M8C21_004847 [Ambrosia artemisiifolia]|uniref:Uncharacterized protein n=1 Tax=Ambrosia artemisiifolia TaxID=4212 RepID=A0AAD5BZL7_AMBAR|nr:hypothetical protein M8C21_004847 [Ambrosia artemisiifolia]
MAPQRCITFFSCVVFVILFCILCYTFSYHEHVRDYKSGILRACTWHMKTVKDYMFQESEVFDSLDLVSTKIFDVDSYGDKDYGKKDDTAKTFDVDSYGDKDYGKKDDTAKTFDVDSYGAKGDGKKDDTKAFKKAWKDACSSTTAAVFHVTKNKKYLVTPIKFEGPCKASLTMQVIS